MMVMIIIHDDDDDDGAMLPTASSDHDYSDMMAMAKATEQQNQIVHPDRALMFN